jgi:hypothetical protein
VEGTEVIMPRERCIRLICVRKRLIGQHIDDGIYTWVDRRKALQTATDSLPARNKATADGFRLVDSAPFPDLVAHASSLVCPYPHDRDDEPQKLLRIAPDNDFR